MVSIILYTKFQKKILYIEEVIYKLVYGGLWVLAHLDSTSEALEVGLFY